MCGICGIISNNDKLNRENQVQEMNQAIIHRGPDDSGFFSDNNCSLAMRRLSIIDLKSGKQPIYSNSKKLLIFFNGEIYNYLELKVDLRRKGYIFHSDSDTEVVVNLYECYGIEMLKMLKGMFAFCIYHIDLKKYFFARDRFGEKPLFYYHANGSFYFSSEINSLLKSKEVPRILNKNYLGVYLSRSFIPDPFTLFKGIKSLPPGHYLILTSESIQITSFFSVSFKTDKTIKSIEDATSFIRPFLENAVQRQMISDVPIGAFLSGGIDSSSIVALMQKFSSNPIKTFNVKFQTLGYDESKIAKKVSEKIGTDHHEILIENNGFKEEQFWKILKHVGLPFPDSSAIPTDFVTAAISKEVKVALSGDGGDELFAGYDFFDWYTSINKLKRVPLFLRQSSNIFFSYINKSFLGNNSLRKIEKALYISSFDSEEMLEEIHALFDLRELKNIYPASKIIDESNKDLSFNGSLIQRAIKYRLNFDLPLDMLVKVDRMSMSNSLEVRAPFLDPDLFDASTMIPDSFLRKSGLGKIVLRDIMKDTLPYEVFNHPKSGFSIPMHDFKNTAFRKLAINLLNKDYMKELFNPLALDLILEIGLNDNHDNFSGSIYRKTHQLWSLMMLSGWIKEFDVDIT